MPGRALITWCVFGNDGAQWHRQKWFVDKCAAMKCEYLLVDGGWRTEKWGFLSGGGDLWTRLRELCEYGAARGVDIVVWNAYPEGRDDGPGLTDPAARRDFFRRCREAGAKGVKIDFFDSESKATVDVQEELLRLAAEHRLCINFHGANKPTGLLRTWPNQVTQEGIREQEYLLWDRMNLPHYAALPFTRMVAGHGDFLPTYVRKKYLKNTTATFQLATAIVSNSTFLCWPDHPDDYLNSPLLGIVREMPVVWDETRVLEGSRIGQLAAFARRSGDDWFIGVINGQAQKVTWSARLDFLGSGPYQATLYRDQPPQPESFNISANTPIQRDKRLDAELAPGGGFVAWIRPIRKE
jgi:alpha-glucosidase